MKFNKWVLYLAVSGAAGMASVTCAQVAVVNDTSDVLENQFVGVGNDMAETFSTGLGGGDISQIILSLNFAGASQTGIFLYTTSGAPESYETLQIGTVSTSDYIGQNSDGQDLYRVALSAGTVAANPLAEDTDYAVSVEGQGAGDNLYWDSTSSGDNSTGTGSFLGAYYVASGVWHSDSSIMPGMEVDVSPVPEPSAGELAFLSVIVLLIFGRFTKVGHVPLLKHVQLNNTTSAETSGCQSHGVFAISLNLAR
jgi:hypothetical protein